MEYKDKVQRKRRYKKLICGERCPWTGYRNYYYEEKYTITLYGKEFKFRYDPVPNISNYKNSIIGYYRHPKTTQEKRYYHTHKEFTRGKRSPRYLPGWYDDIPHARREKGWKRSKKCKQWMKGSNKSKKVSWKDFYTEE